MKILKVIGLYLYKKLFLLQFLEVSLLVYWFYKRKKHLGRLIYLIEKNI